MAAGRSLPRGHSMPTSFSQGALSITAVPKAPDENQTPSRLQQGSGRVRGRRQQAEGCIFHALLVTTPSGVTAAGRCPTCPEAATMTWAQG